jgi:hypothetical protein
MRLLALFVIVSACAAPKRPTVTGAELYAQVETLRTKGEAVVGTVPVRKEHVLAAGDQTFLVRQVIENCRGGDPAADVDCTLALLVAQRFTVLDRLPTRREPKPDREDRSSSALTSIVVLGLGGAAIGGLVYGVATCEFEGCRAVFGVPLVLVGGALLFALLGH